MNFWEAGNSLVRAAESAVSEALETVTAVLAGAADPLRDGTEHDPVELPRDLAAHPEAQTEWWYYTGHAETVTGRQFGFELVFFKRRTDLDKFSVVPLRLIGNPFYFAHFAITDISNKTFVYEHLKSSNGPLDLPAAADEEQYFLRIGDWSAYESNGVHVLCAGAGRNDFHATLRPIKEAVRNGIDGVSFKDKGEASRYFSYTRMAVDGTLLIDGRAERFHGSAWMDREFGTWQPTEKQKGWDWFSIQLSNNTELMCYQLRDSQGVPSEFSSGTFVDADGTAFPLTSKDFNISASSHWTSPRTGARYPISWQVNVPQLGIDLEIDPHMEDQELDTRGTTMIVYWEGACSVKGSAGDAEVSGNAYVEMVGYDRSHDQPNLATFLIGDPLGLFSRLSK